MVFCYSGPSSQACSHFLPFQLQPSLPSSYCQASSWSLIIYNFNVPIEIFVLYYSSPAKMLEYSSSEQKQKFLLLELTFWDKQEIKVAVGGLLYGEKSKQARSSGQLGTGGSCHFKGGQERPSSSKAWKNREKEPFSYLGDYLPVKREKQVWQPWGGRVPDMFQKKEAARLGR